MPFVITLTPDISKDTFPFETKHLQVCPGEPVLLGSAEQTGAQGEPSRKSDENNGWFGPLPTQEDVFPLSLCGSHAKLYAKGGKVRSLFWMVAEAMMANGSTARWQVFIKDMDTAFGTFVNDKKLTAEMELLDGDIIVSGIRPSFLNLEWRMQLDRKVVRDAGSRRINPGCKRLISVHYPSH